MKNGKLVSAYLDECAALTALQKADFEAWIVRTVEGTADTKWFACIDDGWTVAEMDAAFERRFGVVVKRG